MPCAICYLLSAMRFAICGAGAARIGDSGPSSGIRPIESAFQADEVDKLNGSFAMNPFKNLFIVGCLAALGAGCASGPRYANFRPAVQPPPEGYGRIWFYRPAVMGAEVQPAVKVDGQPVGRAISRGVFYA